MRNFAFENINWNYSDMNILILSGSPRKGGNTELLVEAFFKGASQKHHVEVVSVHDYKVNPCLGCNACFGYKILSGKYQYVGLKLNK